MSLLVLSTLPAGAEVLEVPPDQGIQFGQGINSVSAAPQGLCVASGPVTSPPPGQTVEFRAKRIDTRDELETFLAIDAQASLNIPFMASGKFRFLMETYRLETATYFFVSMSVRNPTRNLTEHRWASPLPLEFLAQGPEHFLAACGDRFVHGVTSGGEMILEISVRHVTQKEKAFVEGKLDANLWIIQGSADLQAKLRKLHQETSFSYRLYRRGTIEPVLFDLEELMEQIQDFPLDVAQSPWDMSFEVLPYSVLLGYEPSDLFPERQYVRALARLHNSWTDTADRLDSVMEDRWQFARTVGPFRLSRSIARARVHTTDLDGAFRNCVASLPGDCQTDSFPEEPSVVNVPRRILLDTLWKNGGTPSQCQSAVSTSPRAVCSATRIGYIVKRGSWASTELFEAPRPPLGEMALWTDARGESVGWTMRQPLGAALYACPSGRVLAKRGGFCNSTERATELVGYAFNPRQ